MTNHSFINHRITTNTALPFCEKCGLMGTRENENTACPPWSVASSEIIENAEMSDKMDLFRNLEIKELKNLRDLFGDIEHYANWGKYDATIGSVILAKQYLGELIIKRDSIGK